MTTTAVFAIPTVEDARRAAAALRAEHPEIEAVVLFGSVATSTATEQSDIDLLVIMDTPDCSPSEFERLQKRLQARVHGITGFDCDAMPITPRQLAWSIKYARSSVYSEAIRHGRAVSGDSGAYRRHHKIAETEGEAWEMARNDRKLAIDDIVQAGRKAREAQSAARDLVSAVDELERMWALQTMLEDSHACMEACLNALGRLHKGRVLNRKHKLEVMLEELADESDAHAAASLALNELPRNTVGEFTVWRRTLYAAETPEMLSQTTEENAIAHLMAAADLLEYVAKGARRPLEELSPLTAAQAAKLQKSMEVSAALRAAAISANTAQGPCDAPTP